MNFMKLIYKYNVLREEYKHSCTFHRQTTIQNFVFNIITYIITCFGLSLIVLSKEYGVIIADPFDVWL